MKRPFFICLAMLACFSYVLTGQIMQRPETMTFFITSVGMGNGGNLGGLAGADKHCATLATKAGAPATRTWRAYLSTQGRGAVNARDRIGKGPWKNALGAEVAPDLALLHGDAGQGSILNRSVAVTERGRVVEGEKHDMLTGSQVNGNAFTDGKDHTCNNWTSNASTGSVRVGHHDISLGGGGGGFGGGGPLGGGAGFGEGGSDRGTRDWNSSHDVQGCAQADLEKFKSGAGLFYCFATN
jgi:hypothetical protein